MLPSRHQCTVQPRTHNPVKTKRRDSSTLQVGIIQLDEQPKACDKLSNVWSVPLNWIHSLRLLMQNWPIVMPCSIGSLNHLPKAHGKKLSKQRHVQLIQIPRSQKHTPPWD